MRALCLFPMGNMCSKCTLKHCRINYNPLKSFTINLNFQNALLGLLPLSEVVFSENNLLVQVNRDTR